MTSEEKAKELVGKFLRIEDDTTFYWEAYYDTHYTDNEVLPHAKKCALTCVDEIINTDILTPGKWHEIKETAQLGYWEDVKKEIEKL